MLMLASTAILAISCGGGDPTAIPAHPEPEPVVEATPEPEPTIDPDNAPPEEIVINEDCPDVPVWQLEQYGGDCPPPIDVDEEEPAEEPPASDVLDRIAELENLLNSPTIVEDSFIPEEYSRQAQAQLNELHQELDTMILSVRGAQGIHEERISQEADTVIIALQERIAETHAIIDQIHADLERMRTVDLPKLEASLPTVTPVPTAIPTPPPTPSIPDWGIADVCVTDPKPTLRSATVQVLIDADDGMRPSIYLRSKSGEHEWSPVRHIAWTQTKDNAGYGALHPPFRNLPRDTEHILEVSYRPDFPEGQYTLRLNFTLEGDRWQCAYSR